jgi:glycosyltransferase involved in cell wall biosynthesis
MGANPSRNRAIRDSKGEFVALLDDDSIAAPDWLERLLAGFVSERVAAVTGRVNSDEARNIYDLTLKGTQRVVGSVHATRLVGCNMCVRRCHLVAFMLDEDRAAVVADTSSSGRGDEEGLYLGLKAAGYEIRVVHDAVVLHDHHYTRRAFFRQAFRGGRSTARLGYKYHLRPRVELVPLLLAYVLLPVAWVGPWVWVAPALPAGLFLPAITYNDLFRKGKTVWETLITYPMLLVYYHLRLAGYVLQHARFLLRLERIERVRFPRAASSAPQ